MTDFLARLLAGGVLVLGGNLHANWVELTTVADTTLIETTPNNNLGGAAFFNAGTTQNNTRNRGLLRFDFSRIPPGSKILSAELLLTVTRQPVDGYSPCNFGLHRVLKPWGEGGRNPSQSPGQGSPALQGEATWLHRFFGTPHTWDNAGGAADLDYVALPSSSEFVYDVGSSPYLFASSPRLVQDIATWVNQPSANYGWMLKADPENVPFTARRFGSREDETSLPLLQVTFEAPPRVSIPLYQDGRVQFTFPAEPNRAYRVESTPNLVSPQWSGQTNVPAAMAGGTVVIHFAVTPETTRFYRVVAE